MLKVFEFTPTPLNSANDVSASGFFNARTFQESNYGGLVIGDMIDLDGLAAANLSNLTIGQLFQGRYRRILVDINATAANVKRGTAAYVVPGPSLLLVILATAGSGQTPGTYQLAATGGGGSGAVIQIIVSSAGTVLSAPTVVAPGSGYTTVPTFAFTAAGGTAATFQAQMTIPSFTVTTADKAGVNPFAPRGVFLNSITPGNYGWIQEDGIASVLQAATVTSATVGAVVTPVSGGNGTSQSTVGTAAATPATIGSSLDAPVANQLFRVLLNIPVWNA